MASPAMFDHEKLDVYQLVAKAFTTLEALQPGKEMLLRIVAMLSKLVERFDPEQYRVREDISGASQKFEDEDEHEDEDEMRDLAKKQHSEE